MIQITGFHQKSKVLPERMFEIRVEPKIGYLNYPKISSGGNHIYLNHLKIRAFSVIQLFGL